MQVSWGPGKESRGFPAGPSSGSLWLGSVEPVPWPPSAFVLCLPAAAVPVLSPGTLESDLSKVRHRLRKFLQRRPTLQSLRDKGYIRGT